MKRLVLYTVFIISLANVQSFAQLLTNDGAAIFSSSGALIFVDGEMLNQGLGTFDNNGAIELTGDWTNNAGNATFINGSPGSVTMTGGTQNIKGTDPTLFYDLILTGTGDKSQQVNATVTDSLALNDKELLTDTFLMHVTNTSSTSITRTTGFVSSIDTGGLARDMASFSTYLFPVGSSVGVQRYRPVEITPTASTPHTYKVRMANDDATNEGYDRSVNDSNFCVINPDYYHRIYQTNGSSAADVSIYYDDVLDNAFQAIAHWQNAPRWEDISPIVNTVNSSPALSYMTKAAWNDFTLPSFALATTTPVVSLSAIDTSVCEGDTLNFTVSSGFANYEFFNNSITVQNGAANTYQITGLTTGDTIRVTATVLTCVAFSNEIVVTVDQRPVIDTLSMIITDDNCGAGAGSIVGITATGSGPLTYEWVDGSTGIVGGDSANVMNLPTDNYVLTVTSGAGCADSIGVFNISGGLAPTLSSTGVVLADPMCGSSNGDITGITISGGTGPLTYDWVNGVPTSVGSTIDLTSIGAETYTLMVTDSAGCTDTSGPHTLTDQPGPQLDTTGFIIAQSTCSASDGSITGISVSGGTGVLTFDWVNSGATSVGSTLDLNAVAADSYILTVTDSNGCTDVTGAHSISDAGAPTINSTAVLVDSSRCDIPTGSITGLTVSGGTAPLTYLWNSNPLQSTWDATGLDAGNYAFVVTDAFGCNTLYTATVPYFSSPAPPTAASPAPYCSGDVIADLTATGTSGTIIWYSDVVLTDSIGTGSPFTSGATSDTSYWVSETKNGCTGLATQVDLVITPTPLAPFAGADAAYCQGDVINDLIASGSGGTEWWSDQGLSSSLGTGDTLSILPGIGTTVYYVTQSAGTCQGPYDSVIVTLDAPITVIISGNTTICSGNSTTLTASGGTTYLWSTTEVTASIVVSPLVETVYNVFATSGACSATSSDTVTVNSLPIANITASGTALLCAGQSLTLIADTAQTYSWDTSPISTSQVITVTPAPGTNIIYTLTVTNSCGSDVATQAVSAESTLSAGPDLDLCKNTDFIGYGATSFATPVNGTWSSPNSLVFPGNLQSDGFVDHISIPWGAGYELVYTSASGNCTDTLLLEVTGAEAGADSMICPSSSTFFLPIAQPSNGTWSSDDPIANNAILDNVTGEVLKDGLAGDYVYVYTSRGCPDSVTVNICGSNDVWVPNIFSPNGDDINSVMFVRGIAVDWVHIKIYDRWGELVYDSGQGRSAMDEGWDGSYKGKELTPQVFVYFLEGAYLDGEVVDMMKGNITLVK